MAFTVGQIIMAIRTAITDMPAVLPPPGNPTVAAVTASGATLPAGTYRLLFTFRTPWGETSTNSTEQSVVITSGKGIQVSGISLPPGASFLRAYFTLADGAAGTEQQFVESSTVPFTITAQGTMGVPPSTNSAYIPDADGDSFSAQTVYNWLNDALKMASQICGGLIDFSGVGTVSGVGQYIIPNQWRTISDVWYDGYPLAPDRKGSFFRRNPITANVLASVTTSMLTDRMMLEVWPQAARTATQTTLAADMGVTDTTAQLTNAGGFLLAIGFVQIGSEICSYSGISGNNLTNLVRGMSGTGAVAHTAGETVKELNLFFSGWRVYEPSYYPGQASSSIPVPVGWETMLPIYALARVKLAEQNVQEYRVLKDDFGQMMSQFWRTNKVTTGPRQVGQGINVLETYGGTIGGGVVVP